MLPATPYLDGAAQVAAGNGDYVEVQNFLGSTASDRHFLVLVDQADRATIRFGNGTSGVVPSGTIIVRYKTGGGATGNVNAGTLSRLEGSFTDANGNPVSLSATNPQPASGGTDRQSIAQTQALAPESIRALSRTVSREDYEVNARRLPAVARALLLTSNEDAGIAENTGILFIIPRGGGVPSPTLKITAYAGEALILGESLLGEDWVLGPSSSFAALAFEVTSPRVWSSRFRPRSSITSSWGSPSSTTAGCCMEEGSECPRNLLAVSRAAGDERLT